MTSSLDAITALARAFHTRVRKTPGSLPNGDASAETRFRRGSLRFTVFAAAGAPGILIEVRGFTQAPMKFSLNHAEWDAGEVIDQVGTASVLAYPKLGNLDALRQWLSDAHHRALLSALTRRPEEYVHVYQNGIEATVLPESAVPDLVVRLEALVAALPAGGSGDDLEGIELLPARLRALVPFFADWAIGDDEERTRKLEHARKPRLRQVRNAVEPLLPEINDYLDSFGSRPLTEAAIRLGDLAQAIAEIRVRDA